MNRIKVLYSFILFSFLICSLHGCSDKKEEEADDPIGFVLINGMEHRVLDTGYIFSGTNPDTSDTLWIELIIEDREFDEETSVIQFQLPLDATEEWFHFTECESYWRVRLRSLRVGDNSHMDLISEGKVLVKQLGEKESNKDCKYQIAFEILLIDGTKAVADIQTIFLYDHVLTGGR